jgi:alkylhydroperoxidase/carboxymuconolactone decarboxylase family protein YurZ
MLMLPESSVLTDTRPRTWRMLAERQPAVAEAYDSLSDACRSAGPLDAQTVALLKVAVSIGKSARRTIHAHARKALGAGVDPDAVRQVAFVALPTIGLPAALDAWRWIEETIDEARP